VESEFFRNAEIDLGVPEIPVLTVLIPNDLENPGFLRWDDLLAAIGQGCELFDCPFMEAASLVIIEESTDSPYDTHHE
jgi:hypothetical protein